MSPEDRARTIEQMRARGIDPATLERGTAGGRAGDGSGEARPAESARAGRGNPPPDRQPTTTTPPAATTFDALFAPLPTVENPGRVWLYTNNQLTPLRVRTGVSDGQNTELIDGELEEGVEVVTNVIIETETRPDAWRRWISRTWSAATRLSRWRRESRRWWKPWRPVAASSS